MVDTKSNCEALEWNNILGLSLETNAHGELIQPDTCIGTSTYDCSQHFGNDIGCNDNSDVCHWSAPTCNKKVCLEFDDETDCNAIDGCGWEGLYNYALCCDGNGIQPNECLPDKTNKIVGLSSETNAHAEIPVAITDDSRYPSLEYGVNEVCYGTLNCETKHEYLDGACSGGKEIMLSLSDYGNAHIGLLDTYSLKICCEADFQGGTFCGDRSVQNDPPNDNDLEEECDFSDYCIMVGDEKCTCWAGYESEYDDIEDLWYCKAIEGGTIYWSEDYIGMLQLPEKNIIVGETTIYLIKSDIDPDLDGTQVEFEIYEDDWFGDDNIRTGSNALSATFVNGKAIANWTISIEDIENSKPTIIEGDLFEFYFEVDGDTSAILDINITAMPSCDTKLRCMDYNEAQCGLDACQIASDSLESIDCDDPDINCYCEFDQTNNACAPAWGIPGVGTCSYEEITDDNCDDMFLTYSWISTWTDLEDLDGVGEALCGEGGSSTIPCPAQIQLSFFNYYNAIVIIVLIALIYFLIGLNKKKLKRKANTLKGTRKKKK
ncbi:hypothetical protein HQ529_02535 [Candidatus Woesearchaeota archaeon]|nr:hypothetical protein [Candidatus Woesearchaeota archaeon]